MQNILHKNINNINRKMDIIINLLSNSELPIQIDNFESDTSLLPDFPLSTMNEFQKFEAELHANNGMQKQLVNILNSYQTRDWRIAN